MITVHVSDIKMFSMINVQVIVSWIMEYGIYTPVCILMFMMKIVLFITVLIKFLMDNCGSKIIMNVHNDNCSVDKCSTLEFYKSNVRMNVPHDNCSFDNCSFW